MTDNVTLARPYAKAAFEFAKEHNTLPAWSTFLQTAAMVVVDPRVNALIINPKIERHQLLGFITGVCEKVSDDAHKNLLELLVENHRLELLPDIAAIFEHLLSQTEQTIEADVFAAMALDDAQQAKLQQALEKKWAQKVSLSYHIDESLLGGLVIRAGDEVIDNSVKTKLHRLREDIVKSV